MSSAAHDLRVEFVGDIIQHTSGGRVFCNGEPEYRKVTCEHEDACMEEMTAGDTIYIYYVRRRDESEWFQLFRYCGNYKSDRLLEPRSCTHGEDQAYVKGTIEPFEGVINGTFYDDAVRLNDIEVLAYSPVHEGC